MDCQVLLILPILLADFRYQIFSEVVVQKVAKYMDLELEGLDSRYPPAIYWSGYLMKLL